MADTFANAAKSLLDQQVEVTRQMLDILQKEYAVLKQTDVGDLQELAQQKQAQVDNLEGLSQQWLAMLQTSNIQITLDGIRTALQQADPGDALLLVATWEKLGELATECRRQNSVNGAVVVVRQQSTQSTLDILRGANPGEDNTYTAQGRASANSGVSKNGIPLGKA